MVDASSVAGGAPKTRAGAKFLVRILILAGIVGGLWLVWRRAQPPEPPETILPLSGRLECDESSIAAKATGKIKDITVREGDQVKAGQVLAWLDDPQLAERESQASYALEQAEAQAKVRRHQVEVATHLLEQSRLERQKADLESAGKVTQSEADARAAQEEIAVLEQQLQESELGVEQSRTESLGRVRQAEKQEEAAAAEVRKVEAQLAQARVDASRYANLLAQGAVDRRTAEQQSTSAATLEASLVSARKQLAAAQGATQIARSSLDNPAIRATQTEATRRRIAVAQSTYRSRLGNVTASRGSLKEPAALQAKAEAAAAQVTQAKAELAAAQAAVGQARAKLGEARADKADLKIVAPFEGVVATRVAEPGELVTPGDVIITIVDLRKVYLRGFIPEGLAGKVKLGQSARVYLDSAPEQALQAVVARVDPQLSFTPENTYFRDDRVKQVLGLRLDLQDGFGYAKPGMPAEGDILLAGPWIDWR